VKTCRVGNFIRKKYMKLTEKNVQDAVVKYLSTQGWGYFQFDEIHTKGVDLRAKKIRYNRYLYVEAKGYGKKGQNNEVNFVYSLGQIITRMKDTASTRNYYGIALPSTSARIALRRLPWQIAKKLLLYVFSVDKKGIVKEYSWKELKDEQE
jgi:hypothetical protein